ncbi:hypothetical protein Tco_0227636 [Tanacetum coccineum]
MLCLIKISLIMDKKETFFQESLTYVSNMFVQPTEDDVKVFSNKDHLNNHNLIPSSILTQVKPMLISSTSDKSLSRSEGGLTLQSVYDLYLSSCTRVTTQAAEIKSLMAQVKKLKKQARPFILHHKAWLRTVKRKNQNKKKVLKTSKRRSVFKQGRKTIKSSKGAPTYHKNPETKLSNQGQFEEGTAEPEPRESTSSAAQTTPTTFGDDETIAQVLLNMSQAKAVSKEKEKGNWEQPGHYRRVIDQAKRTRINGKQAKGNGAVDWGMNGYFEYCALMTCTLEITVVTLVEEQMSPWKGNLPKLPIESNIVRLATTSIVALEVQGNLIDGKSTGKFPYGSTMLSIRQESSVYQFESKTASTRNTQPEDFLDQTLDAIVD